MREVDMLKRRDAENKYIKFVDIADPAYQPGENAGVTFEQACIDLDRRARPDVTGLDTSFVSSSLPLGLPPPFHPTLSLALSLSRSLTRATAFAEQAMERIHGIYPDGRFVVDIAAFKAFYELVGLGWVYKVTEVEFVNKALNAVYGVWAKVGVDLDDVRSLFARADSLVRFADSLVRCADSLVRCADSLVLRASYSQYRLAVTGRPDLATILAEKKTCASVREGQK
jgi:predicted DCC family thiol-disulfide oxidoreductase YuxK